MTRIALLERSSLAGMTIGVATMLQPWWSGGMRAGFFVAAACTLAQIVLSHWPQGRETHPRRSDDGPSSGARSE